MLFWAELCPAVLNVVACAARCWNFCEAVLRCTVLCCVVLLCWVLCAICCTLLCVSSVCSGVSRAVLLRSAPVVATNCAALPYCKGMCVTMCMCVMLCCALVCASVLCAHELCSALCSDGRKQLGCEPNSED